MRKDKKFKGFFTDFLGIIDGGNEDKFPYSIPDDKVCCSLFLQPTLKQKKLLLLYKS
jgi:hypothetical protein